jgi:hypothetical protein
MYDLYMGTPNAITWISDTHSFSPYESMPWQRALWEIKHAPVNMPPVYGGDILDFKNAKKSDLPAVADALRIMQAAVQAASGYFLYGNHELVSACPRFTIIGNTYLSHGDWEMWGEAKSIDYRSKTPGAGWFKRTFFSPALEEARDVWGARFSDAFFQRIEEIKRLHPEIKQYICGHGHPHAQIVVQHAGVTCQMMPRGVTRVPLL